MKRHKQTGRRAWLVLLGIIGLLIAPLGVGAAPARQEQIEFGIIHVMALEGSGNGYAWASIRRPPPPGEGYRVPGLAAPVADEHNSYLLRMEGDRSFVIADTSSAPTILEQGLDVWRMSVTADGRELWAIGKVEHAGAADTPAVLHLKDGQAERAEAFLNGALPVDLTLSADGTQGWITAVDAQGGYHLFTRRSGAWVETAQPAAGPVVYLAISADGQQGWAAGPHAAARVFYRLANGAWVAEPGRGDARTAGRIFRIAADNNGQGYALVAPDTAATTASRMLALAGGVSISDLAPVAAGATPAFADFVVAGNGRGWLVGTVNGTPAFFRLDGASPIGATTPGGAGVPAGFALPISSLAISPDGNYVWVGNEAGKLTALSAVVGMPSTGLPSGLLWAALLALAGLLVLAGRTLQRSVQRV